MNKFNLTERVILLTGAAGYLGSGISYGVLEAGATLIAVGRNIDTLGAVHDQLPANLRPRFYSVSADITNDKDQIKICEEIKEKFGRLDGIVHNAYSGIVGPLDAITDHEFLSACSYNMIAPFRLSHMLSPLLNSTAYSRSGTASIVNIASMYGIVSPDPTVYGDTKKNNPIHYGASKAGMIQMTRYLACHLSEKQIRVNSVSPGPFPNPEGNHSIENFVGILSQKVPMGRVGRLDDIAGPVVFLLSDAASYVTGANLPVDGGWTAW